MKNVLTIIIFLFAFVVSAQQKDKILPKANEEYADNKFSAAEADYRISAARFPSKTAGTYNLGNAIYKQNQAAEAKFAYTKALKLAKTRPEKHRAFHNLGNVFMKEKDYTQAVEAYKNALRNNPSDDETRYNYALAKKMLKENPPKDDKKDDKKDKKDDKKDNKDKDKDKKDDQKNKDKEKKDDKGDQDKDKKDPKQDENGEPKQMPGGMSKERLENLLDAVNKEEKKVQDKVNAQKVKGKPNKTEKDW